MKTLLLLLLAACGSEVDLGTNTTASAVEDDSATVGVDVSGVIKEICAAYPDSQVCASLRGEQ